MKDKNYDADSMLQRCCSAWLCFLISFIHSPTFFEVKASPSSRPRPRRIGDLRVRAVLPFLQKYIPGNPTFVHEYMDGGGGRKAANHIFAMSAHRWLGPRQRRRRRGCQRGTRRIRCAVRSRQAALHRLAVQRYSLRASHSQGGRSDKSGETARRNRHSPRRPIRRPYQLHHRQNIRRASRS